MTGDVHVVAPQVLGTGGTGKKWTDILIYLLKEKWRQSLMMHLILMGVGRLTD